MKKAMLPFLGALFVTTALSTPIQADDLTDRALVRADWMFTRLHKMTHVPGMSLAFGAGDEVIFSRGYGYADLENLRPVTPETRFRFASVSKVFAITAAAQLYEQDLLDLDADVRGYVPDFPDKGFPITSRQIAAHMSGIPHYQEPLDAERGTVHYETVSDALAIFQDRDLLFEPGTGYEYSSYAYTLLSAAIEQASGQGYLAYLERHIFSPAGISHTFGENMNEDFPNLTIMYEREGTNIKPAPALDFSYIYAGGGLDGTPTDLVKLAIGHWDETLLSRETRAMMFTPVQTANGGRTGRLDYEVGFGWRIGEDWFGRDIIHHAGGTPGARAILLMYPADGVHIAMASNSAWTSSVERTVTTLAFSILRALEGRDIETDCPVGSYAWVGTFNEEPAEGTLRIREKDADCTGAISMPTPFATWVAGFNAPVPEELPVMLLGEHDDRMVFGMVTPLGLFETEMEAVGDGLKGRVRIGATRMFEFNANE